VDGAGGSEEEVLCVSRTKTVAPNHNKTLMKETANEVIFSAGGYHGSVAIFEFISGIAADFLQNIILDIRVLFKRSCSH
jgi:hypothetical protein